MRYRLYGKKLYVGDILVYEGDDLDDVKAHYDEINSDLDYISADIIDTLNWTIVSYIDFDIVPRWHSKVRKKLNN